MREGRAASLGLSPHPWLWRLGAHQLTGPQSYDMGELPCCPHIKGVGPWGRQKTWAPRGSLKHKSLSHHAGFLTFWRGPVPFDPQGHPPPPLSGCWPALEQPSVITAPSHSQKSSILTRAGEQRRRSQSMKSYPSSELRNMCDEHVTSEEPGEKEDLLQQMLERR